MSITKSDRYFQFPLKCLQISPEIDAATEEEKFSAGHDIIDWCIQDVGNKADIHDEEVLRIAKDRAANSNDHIKNEYVLRPDHIKLLWATSTLNVEITTIYGQLKSQKARAERIEIRQGGKTLVRVRTDILWDAIKNTSWTWRDFSILCAVYAGIGAKRAANITYEQIGYMALGFTSKKDYQAIRNNLIESGGWDNVIDKKMRRPLTIKQVRGTLDDLESRRLFVSATPNQRHRWYSHCMTLQELMDHIIAKDQKTKIQVDKKTLFATRKAIALGQSS